MSLHLFQITDAGLYAASLATPTGPFIQIVAFKLADDATTPASRTDTRLVGNIVYAGVPSSFSYYDDKTIQINLEVPADVGPFDYGELGLYLPGDILFARFSYGKLLTKNTAISSGYANVLRIKALLRLEQGPAVFNVLPGTTQSTLEVATLNLVNTPHDHPENPLVIVHEPNDFQESILLYRTDQTLWNLVNYTRIGAATISAAPSSTQLVSAFFGTLHQPASGSLGKYVIQTAGGYLRTVSAINAQTITLAQELNTNSLVSQTIAVYELETVVLSELVQNVANLRLSLSNLDLYLGVAVLHGSDYAVNTGSDSLPPEIFSVTFSAPNPINATLHVNGNGPYPLMDPLGASLPINSVAGGETRTLIFADDHCIVQAATAQAFPDGTRIPFNQTTPPPGWVKDTDPALNDSIMRLVTQSISTGGAAAFSTWNAGATVGPAVDYVGTPSSASLISGSVQHSHTLVSNLKYNDFVIGVKGTSVPPVFSPLANFTATPTEGLAPLTVQFTDTSSRNPTAWAWDFTGDGVIDSTARNPSFTYSTPGDYTVSLTASNAVGSDTKQVVALVKVIVNQPPVANFTTDVTSGVSPLTVNFTNTTTGQVDSYLWEFGDGTTSTEQTPTVQLDFTATPTSGDAPLVVTINNLTTAPVASTVWEFGDGTTSTSPNP